MRFLLDEFLSTRLVALLTNAGHDAVHVADLRMLGAPDEKVMRAASGESRVLVSADTDFGELLAAGDPVAVAVLAEDRSRVRRLPLR